MYKYNTEELLSKPETLKIMLEISDNIHTLCEQIKDFHAKTKNYKENVYYHVITPKYEEYIMKPGVGEGLYLGKDKDALIQFYGTDYKDYNKKVPLIVYNGNPNFLDLTDYNDYKYFKEESKKEFPNEENNNELKKMTLKLGYDGIRYYDPLATGEEFVLYNINEIELSIEVI